MPKPPSLLLLLVLFACSTPQQAAGANAGAGSAAGGASAAPGLSCPETPRPGWVDQPQSGCPNGMVCARATGATDEAALAEARVELAKQIGVTIEQNAATMGREVVTDHGAAFAEASHVYAAQFVKQHLLGSKPTDFWCEAATGVRVARAQIALADVLEGVRRALAAEAEAKIELEQRVRLAVNEACSDLPAGAAVCVDRLTVSDSGVSSPLGALLAAHVETVLAAESGRSVFPCRAACRPYRVGGEYFLDDARLNLFVKITDPTTEQMMRKVAVTVARNHVPMRVEDSLPQGLSAGGVEALRPVLPPVVGRIDAGTSAGPLSVSLTPDRGKGATYHQGERLIATVTANRECYAHVFLVDATGAATLIFPNRWQSNNRLTAGVPLRLGDPANRDFLLTLKAPFGTEVLKVIASTRPFTDRQTDEALRALSTSRQPFVSEPVAERTVTRGFLTRGISVDRNDLVIARPDLSTEGRPEWAEAAAVYVSAP